MRRKSCPFDAGLYCTIRDGKQELYLRCEEWGGVEERREGFVNCLSGLRYYKILRESSSMEFN